MSDIILDVKNLKTYFTNENKQTVKAVNGVNFTIKKGEILAIVGESGSGKSVTNLTLLGLLPKGPKVHVSGQALFHDKDLLTMTEKQMQDIRGNKISMIFQDPMTTLNPFLTVSTQLVETVMYHQKLSKKVAKEKAIHMLDLVGIHRPSYYINHYPHQFSGGMRQRVMIAMALSCEPEILIADEPTSALDVTIQAQIIDLIYELIQKLSTSLIMITHDLGIVAGIASQVLVMYAGYTVEEGNVDDIFYNAKHPYTQGLLKSIPRLDMQNNQRLYSIPGQPPIVIDMPDCCPFWSRCSEGSKLTQCQTKFPQHVTFSGQHSASCWLYGGNKKNE